MSDILERVIRVIAETQKIDTAKITPESTFLDLQIDSLDAINILFALENEFNINIPDDQAKDLKTIGNLADGIARLLGEQGGEAALA